MNGVGIIIFEWMQIHARDIFLTFAPNSMYKKRSTFQIVMKGIMILSLNIVKEEDFNLNLREDNAFVKVNY